MDKKIFWKLRKSILVIIFYIKRLLYRIIDFINGKSDYRSFGGLVVKRCLLGMLKAIMFVIVGLRVDGLILKIKDVPEVDKSILVSTVIGGIGVSGVILGLYCANIASIYSLRYVNAPKGIADAFQYDKLTRRCIFGIVDYIIFGFLVILTTMMVSKISWGTVVVFIVWAIAVIVSYSVAGNRTYQLSDVYWVAMDSNRILCRIISKRLKQKMFCTDANFQNHFLKVAEKQIGLLKLIQKYGEQVNKNDSIDNSAMTEFMVNNLILVELYWKVKKNIARSSLWFRDTMKYQRWHFSNSTESSVALRTGTALRTKREHNFLWFEEELISINKNCLHNLFERYDFSSIYSYIRILEKMCSTAIECKEADFYVAHVDWIKQELEKKINSADVARCEGTAFASVIEIVSILYLDFILESSRVYQEFDIKKISLKVIQEIDSGKAVETNKSVCSRQNIDFYKKIITEVNVEGKRITPDWVIKQQIAKEEYVYLNSLLDIVREGMDHAFCLGKALAENELYFEACIILTKFYEYESKYTRFVKIVKSRKEELVSFKIDKESRWDEFRLEKLQTTVSEWKKSVPTLLAKCSSYFALKNWEKREEYPDFLGECYNHICEDAVEAITSGDIKQFEIDFENLSKLMLLYQEYIRTDFINNKVLYRVEYAYYIFTSPIVEWAQIGGLAILWGEFHSDDEWRICVTKCCDLILKKKGKHTELAEKLIEYAQHRNKFIIGIVDRALLETGWQQRVANTIRNSEICETENAFYGHHLKTSSKILNAFCPDFIEFGFTIDPSEVFWVICVNPMIKEDKRFQTKYSWEDKMYD